LLATVRWLTQSRSQPAAIFLFLVPELTRSADVKLNVRLSLRRHPKGLSLSHRTFPQVRLTSGKAVRRSYSAWRLCLSAGRAKRQNAPLLDDHLSGCDCSGHDRLAVVVRLDRQGLSVLVALLTSHRAQQIDQQHKPGHPNKHHAKNHGLYRAHGYSPS
jgi:hypothetical protein